MGVAARGSKQTGGHSRGFVGSQTDPFSAYPSASIRPDPALDEQWLAWIIRIVTWLILGMAIEAMVMAAMTHAPGYVAQALLFVAAAVWLSWARARLGTRGAGWFASRVAIVMLVTLVVLVLLVPSVAPYVAVAPFVPLMVALPYLGTRALRRLAAATWAVALGVAVVAAAVAVSSPPALLMEAVVLGLVNTAVAAGLMLYLLWGYRERLTASSRDMSRLMRLSRDVSGTLDPARVAELLARHLQETMRADLCVISVYRADEGEVRTFASWPPEYAASYDRSYTLDEFPLTRRVVEAQELTSMHVDDPGADAAEVAVLVEEGANALLMVPLVARGETIGVAEIDPRRPPLRLS